LLLSRSRRKKRNVSARNLRKSAKSKRLPNSRERRSLKKLKG